MCSLIFSKVVCIFYFFRSVGCTIVEMFIIKLLWVEFESMVVLYKIVMEKRLYFILLNYILELCYDVFSKVFDRNSSIRLIVIDLLGYRWVVG